MATYIHYYCILLFLRLTTPCVSLSDQDLLLRVKISITDPTSSLSSWAPTTPICNWTGISCSSTSPPTVFALNLHSLNLSGEISPSICSLPSLSHLNLAHNSFNTPIPLHISQCTSLLSLNLSSNSLWGTLPDQLSLLSSLTVLDLASNRIEGQLPPALGSLASLQVLDLGRNLFSEHKCSKKATEQMDVYSFGVVLLELITGRLAEEQETGEALDVVKWVRRKINVTNGSFQVLDPKISSSYLHEMFGALDLALRCTSVMPERRPLIDEVVRSLEGLCSDNHPMVHPDELSISN